MKGRFAWPLLVLLLPGLPQAAELSTNPLGVWSGTLGGAAVKACFNQPGAGANYYYTKYREPISLTSKDGRWQEQQGTWTLDSAASDGQHLHGMWASRDGSRTLPIALTLVDGAGDPKACMRDSFALPLEQAPLLKQGKRQSYNGHAYRTLDVAGQQTLELLDEGKAVVSINRQLRALLDESPGKVAEYREAYRRMLGGDVRAGGDELLTEPAFWSPSWVTIHFYRWAAGTGKSGISYGNLTWSLATGQRVDLWRWFGGRDAHADDPYYAGHAAMPAALRGLAFKDAAASPENDECAPNEGPQAEYLISLRSDGMDFMQDARGDGCDLSFSFSFDELLPVMTNEGRAAVAAMARQP
jgi:hypothetical protein